MSETINLRKKQPLKLAFLIPLHNSRRPQIIDGTLSLGRGAHHNMSLNDPHVSHNHCLIERKSSGYFIRDQKSRNGVLVNGVRVAECELHDGARIQIGTSEFLFRSKIDDKEKNHVITSKNHVWNQQLQSLPSIAETGLPVYLRGESGAGKEVLAQQIHKLSSRKNGAFISVNCSSLTESLIESELFGHTKGSFTGASHDRKGAFEMARGGTLFLDEIGDLPLNLQPKLLRALENQEIKPLGSDKVVSTNVRIISATHKNLEKLIHENKFRADLYFRLHVIKITIPALRERMEDFEDLLTTLCAEQNIHFSPNAIHLMQSYIWTGNIRELKNVIGRARALFKDQTIEPLHLPHLLDTDLNFHRENKLVPYTQAHKNAKKTGKTEADKKALKNIEKEFVIARLIANHGNQRKTATDLGLAKSTFHDRLKVLGINVKSLFDL